MGKPPTVAGARAEGDRDKPGPSWLGFAFIPLCLAGCATPNRTTGADPLLGGPGLRPMAQATPQPATPVATLPLVPAATSGSNAALASTGGGQLDRNRVDQERDLRIPPAGGAANDAWAHQEAVTVVRGEGSGAVLRAPEPAVEPAPRHEATPVALAGNRLTSFEQAQTLLTARGVLWQRLESISTNGDWKFSCSVPLKQDPRKHRTYEGRDRDAFTAIQAVLDQIDRDQ